MYHINRSLIAETGVIPAGMQLIRDTFPFKVIDKKEVVTEDRNGNEVPVMRITGLFQEGDKQNANQRLYSTKEVLIPAVQSIQEEVENRAVIGEYDHPCLTNPNFKVLTVEGWKDFSDIKIGDMVWSRVNGKMVKSRVNAIVNEPYDGTAYRISSKNINVEFTPGHRFLFEKRPDQGDHSQLYATVADVHRNRKSYSHCRVPTTATYEKETTSYITISGVKELVKDSKYYATAAGGSVTEDLVLDAKLFSSFVGLYLAEGGVQNNTVTICQKTEIGKELIRDLLTKLGFNFKENNKGFSIADKRLAEFLKPCGNIYDKQIPAAIKELDSECLEALVYWFAIGDGRMLKGSREGQFLNHKTSIKEENGAVQTLLDLGKYSRVAVFSISKKLIYDLYECVIKTGRSGKISEVVSENDYVYSGHTIKAANKKVLYQLHISRNKGFNLDPRFTSMDPFHHTGNIYCLTVDHGNFYMQANGCAYWTGNCDAKIHLDRASHLITKIWMDGRKVYGEAEILHKLPLGACLRGLFEHKVRVGISSRGVGDMEVVESHGEQMYRVMPGYAFVTWDAVAEPSVSGAILNIQEGLTKRLRPMKKVKNQFSPQVYQKMVVEEINKFFGLK